MSGPEQFNTAGGDDTIVAGPLADVVDAGTADDRVTGGPGADQLHGDAGNDTFTGLTNGDIVDGGAGIDILDLSAVAGGVSSSLDGVANDGPLGSNANVTAVEDVLGTANADLLTAARRRRPCAEEPATTRSTHAAVARTRWSAARGTTPRAWTRPTW